MPKKILIVEDDSFMRFMLKKIIETLEIGLDVEMVEDGLTGCALLEKNPNAYALVLMDIHMPNMSGVEATKRIRENPNDPPSDIPIFAVTVDTEFHDPITIKQHGMNGFIAKPISPGDLVGLISKYC